MKEMNIKYKLITNKNKQFDGKAIKYYEELKHKLIKASRALGFQVVPTGGNPGEDTGFSISPQPARPIVSREILAEDSSAENTELTSVSNKINSELKRSRDKLKALREHSEFIQEIHLTSERSWPIYNEFFNEETGKTEYGPTDGTAYIEDKENLNDYTSDKGRYRFNGKPEQFKVDIHLPYNKENGVKVKDTIKKAQDEAVTTLKEFREKRQTIPSVEKELSRSLQLLQGMPEEFKPSYKVYAGGGYGSQSEDGKFGHERYFIHMEKGTFVKLSQVGKLRRVFEAKKPRTKDHHVGIEIEFVSKYNKYELAQLLFQNDVHEFVQLVQDDSIRVEKEFKYAHELTVLAPEAMIHLVLARVLKAINDKDGSRVGKRCGLHVHLDMRYRDRKKCFYNLTKAQTIMYMMNPASRVNGLQADGKTKDTVYSRRIDLDDIDEAIKQLNASGGREARYCGINPLALDRHQTIEVRIHSGSTNYEKISNWIKLLTTIVNDEKKVDKEFTKVEDFCEHYKLEDMLGYMNERIAKFKDKSGKHITIDEVA